MVRYTCDISFQFNIMLRFTLITSLTPGIVEFRKSITGVNAQSHTRESTIVYIDCVWERAWESKNYTIFNSVNVIRVVRFWAVKNKAKKNDFVDFNSVIRNVFVWLSMSIAYGNWRRTSTQSLFVISNSPTKKNKLKRRAHRFRSYSVNILEFVFRSFSCGKIVEFIAFDVCVCIHLLWNLCDFCFVSSIDMITGSKWYLRVYRTISVRQQCVKCANSAKKNAPRNAQRIDGKINWLFV